jgi:hypothetical protein
MAQGTIEVDLVDVPAAFLRHREISGVLQFVHDAVDGALADADETGDFTQANVGLLRNADEHVGVVGEERPAR